LASWLEKAWYSNNIMVWALAPFTALFWALSAARRLAFSLGLKKRHKLAVPVIVVGNISVGGNGKTPLVVFLAKWLQEQGYRPGVLSRGYGGQSSYYPLQVTVDADPATVGDEPLLMAAHLVCPLVVDPDRPRGGTMLVEQLGCDLIICDDGLQHYALERDVEILVMDGHRRLGNGHLLPMGPLREGAWRLNTVDLIVVNGNQASKGEHLMTLQSGALTNIVCPHMLKDVSELDSPVVAAAGIGNPQRFFNLLEQHQVRLKSTLAFADHHQFSAADLPQETLLMTEKDAVKCRDFAHKDWWYLPVEAKLTEQTKQQLLSLVRQTQAKLKLKRE
jgi:tetraacyldisaccharide 4'-kinase